jgi:S1-C subfamily serine protease
MNAFDGLLLVLLVLSLYTGWRRGLLQQGFALAGTVVGMVAGAAIAPAAADIGHHRVSRLLLALGTVAIAAALGNLAGFLIGRAIRARMSSTRTRRVDAVGGAAISVATLLIATWFLGVNLAGGPLPALARTLQGSAFVRALGTLPPPPPLLEQLGRLADQFGIPDLFVGLPPPLGEPVPTPSDPDVRAAAHAARGSTFEVLGGGCEEGLLNEGTGFVVAPGYLLTNAHVVAGVDEGLAIRDGHLGHHDAVLVAIDTELDLAVLYAPSLSAQALVLANNEVPRGSAGAVLGFPGGPPMTIVPAAVRQALEPVGRDIYDEDPVRRRVYELQARVRNGNSGGPFVLADGRVAGVVFAASVTDPDTGYAIVSTEVASIVARAVGRTAPVPAGRCVV